MQLFDSHTMLQVLLAAVLGGVIGLDRTAVGQFLFSQPVVAAPLTGWVLGDVTSGLVIGGMLELIWVLDMPIGTFVPADSTVTAVAATAVAAIGHGDGEISVIGFCLLLTVVMIPATRLADQLMRHRNARIPELALRGAEGPTEASVSLWHLAGLIAFFLKSFTLCLVLVPCGLAALSLFHQLPAVFDRAMMLFVTFLPLLGVASVARKLSMRVADRALIIGFCVAAVTVQLFHLPVLAAILLSAGGGWAGVRAGGS